MPRFFLTVCLILTLALSARAAERGRLWVGLDDGTLVQGTDLKVLTAGGSSASIFDMEHLLPEKLLSVEPQSSAVRVVPVAPGEEDKIREGPFNAPNPFPGNKVLVSGADASEFDGVRVKFVVIERGDWEDRLDFLKTKYYDGTAAGYEAYLDRNPGGRANAEAYELLAPAWALELLARDVSEDFSDELVEFMGSALKFVNSNVQEQFPDYLYRYILVHRDPRLIAIFIDMFKDSPHQPEIQSIEGEQKFAELLKKNPGKSYMELYGDITSLSNHYWASMELKLAEARAHLEVRQYDKALRAFFIAALELERIQQGLDYGTAVNLEFINTTASIEQGDKLKRTLIENLPLAVTDEQDCEYLLTAIYLFAVQTKDEASDALNIGSGTLVSRGSGYNAYLLMVVRDIGDGSVKCVRIASSEAYTQEQGRSSYIPPDDLYLALNDALPAVAETFAN